MQEMDVPLYQILPAKHRVNLEFHHKYNRASQGLYIENIKYSIVATENTFSI